MRHVHVLRMLAGADSRSRAKRQSVTHVTLCMRTTMTSYESAWLEGRNPFVIACDPRRTYRPTWPASCADPPVVSECTLTMEEALPTGLLDDLLDGDEDWASLWPDEEAKDGPGQQQSGQRGGKRRRSSSGKASNAPAGKGTGRKALATDPAQLEAQRRWREKQKQLAQVHGEIRQRCEWAVRVEP